MLFYLLTNTGSLFLHRFRYVFSTVCCVYVFLCVCVCMNVSFSSTCFLLLGRKRFSISFSPLNYRVVTITTLSLSSFSSLFFSFERDFVGSFCKKKKKKKISEWKSYVVFILYRIVFLSFFSPRTCANKIKGKRKKKEKRKTSCASSFSPWFVCTYDNNN